MLVKICGITQQVDGQMAEEAGADFVGLIFIRESKRWISMEQAAKILAGLKIPSRAVGLFRNEKAETVIKTAQSLGLKNIQLQGSEPAEYVNDVMLMLPGVKILKAFSVKSMGILQELEGYFKEIQNTGDLLGFLLDGPGGGGTGQPFDWSAGVKILEGIRSKLPPIFLAGGLTVDNLEQAIRIVKPDGVDVSSGVEERLGVKNPTKVRTFIRLAKGE